MDDATQQRMITLVAAGLAYLISHQVTERFIDIPEQRGIKDDVLEAVLKGATTAPAQGPIGAGTEHLGIQRTRSDAPVRRCLPYRTA
jgi:hypothetical protein